MHNTFRKPNATAIALVLTSLFLASASFAALDIAWFTIDGGGGTSTGGSYTLSGTIGQPDAGVLTGGTYELQGGFWVESIVGAPVPGDCDSSGTVDFSDYNQFETCNLGPGNGLSVGCGCVDLDLDGHVSMADYAIFQMVFTGP